jgi:hypothetical protein
MLTLSSKSALISAASSEPGSTGLTFCATG